jgi:hypothetical protein
MLVLDVGQAEGQLHLEEQVQPCNRQYIPLTYCTYAYIQYMYHKRIKEYLLRPDNTRTNFINNTVQLPMQSC